MFYGLILLIIKTLLELKKKFININFINNINRNDIYYLPELLINIFPKKKRKC